MKRREFIAAAGAAIAWPLTARAQSATPVVGFLNGGSAQGYARMSAAFLDGLGEAGYAVGRNVAVEYRWAEGQNDRLPALAADLVQRQVAVIAATSTPAVLAAKAATSIIPIVFEIATDPVQLGLVASLSRPGGNITGATQTNAEVAPKRLQLLHELLPAARVMALLVNPNNPIVAETTTSQMLAAARTLGLELQVLNVSTESDLDAVFTKLNPLQVGGLVMGAGEPFFASQTGKIGALAAKHAIPAVAPNREFAAGGGLLSYGADITESYRLAGIYTGRILKGDKPADLPVQQATKVELVINLKAAKALGITVPIPLLGRADEVIE
jgi:putative ABC transport system substrate-binding protein